MFMTVEQIKRSKKRNKELTVYDLQDAVWEKAPDSISLLIESGVKVNEMTILIAIINDDMDTIKCLLNHNIVIEECYYIYMSNKMRSYVLYRKYKEKFQKGINKYLK